MHKKKTRFIICLIAILISCPVFSQSDGLKDKAIKAADNQNYPKAIKLLHKALNNNPNDKEIYYYLGYYYHYNAYDSRPLAGYNSAYSDTVFHYLEKALKIDPDYGNAQYFYTAECGAAISQAIRTRDYGKIKHFYQKAADIGGFPPWAEEFAKTMLSQVEPDGIFITMGDFTFNLCRYLQVCKNYRNDITVIAWGFLNRPYYILDLKNGESRRNIKIDLTEEQIMDMHPYKWDTLTVNINVPAELNIKYGLDTNHKMDWTISPDLQGGRSYLSCETAIILSLIESNNWQRPVFIQSGIAKNIMPGIHNNVQKYGLVDKLMPFDTGSNQWQYNVESLEKMISGNVIRDYNTIIETNQPRVSGLVLYSYFKSLKYLADHYKSSGRVSKIDDILKCYTSRLQIGLLPDYEKKFYSELKNIKKGAQ
ncbi:MAG: hypothetical protein ACQES1_03340 [Bacteroidota bacterium]